MTKIQNIKHSPLTLALSPKGEETFPLTPPKAGLRKTAKRLEGLERGREAR